MSQTHLHANRRILIIDDNRLIHEDFQKILSPSTPHDQQDDFEAKLLGRKNSHTPLPSFDLSFAAQGQDGALLVKHARENNSPIALAFIDIRMPPGWDGVETIERIWEHDPEVQIVICTAYSDYTCEEIVEKFRYTDKLLFIKKPFENVEIFQIACAMVNKWNLAKQLDRQIGSLEEAVAMRAAELEIVFDKQRELEKQFHQAQKMEAVGRLTGGVAHDFNNLLTVVLGYTEILLSKQSELSPGIFEKLTAIQAASKSAAKLTQQLLAFSRQQVSNLEIINLNQIIERDLTRMIEKILEENVALKIELEPNLPNIKADSGQIEQVILNIVINARDAMEEKGGVLEIKSTLRDGAQQKKFVVLEITDNGKGMTKSVKDKIFDPFFTTKEVGKGTGLGLSTVYGIIARSNAQIFVDSAPGQGTKFTISFAAVSEAPTVVVAGQLDKEFVKGTETIMLVEDEEAVRTLSNQILTEAGYKVIEAQNGQEAYDRCVAEQPQFSLLLTDVVMPEMGGKDLALRLSTIMPNMKVLFMSGYTGQEPFLGGSLPNFLQKPFLPSDLLKKVREAIGAKKTTLQAKSRLESDSLSKD